MTYVLIIISFVAMGGPKATTPTVDHMEFVTSQACDATRAWALTQLQANKVRAIAVCQPKGG